MPSTSNIAYEHLQVGARSKYIPAEIESHWIMISFVDICWYPLLLTETVWMYTIRYIQIAVWSWLGSATSCIWALLMPNEWFIHMFAGLHGCKLMQIAHMKPSMHPDKSPHVGFLYGFLLMWSCIAGWSWSLCPWRKATTERGLRTLWQTMSTLLERSLCLSLL